MCGIAGLAGPAYDSCFPLDALAHRGPDQQGEWRSPNDKIWLGHRRLSILDLSMSARQPMECLDGRYIITFNGEIYNFVELRRELQSHGYSFYTDSDTEIIGAAYDLWGEDCLHRFDGMWAFALWDTRLKNLWLSRDRFGKKPLYYFAKDNTLAFASEIQSLHRWLGTRAELDPAVARHICAGRFGWQGTERTYLKDVRSVPAGWSLRKSIEGLVVRRWYCLQPGSIDVPRSFMDQAMALRNLIQDACRLRLRSDVPLATCLSGGIDSSTITAMVHQEITKATERAASGAYEAFCAGFPNTMLDETDGADRMAKALDIKLHILPIQPPSADEILKAIRSMDGPMHALAFYPIWRLFGFIKTMGVKVTLDGQGPDEMMGGYFETIRASMLSAAKSIRPFWFRDIYRTYANLGESDFLSRNDDARRELQSFLKEPFRACRSWICNAFRPQATTPEDNLEFSQPVPYGLSPLKADLYGQFFQSQLPTILQQYDRCSMAHGVECRMPFMDHRIVEFIFSLPEESLIGGGYTKRVLRESIRGLVPDFIRLNRTKIGFNAPLVEWLAGPLRELMRDILASRECRESAYFNGRSLADSFSLWLQDPQWNSAWEYWPPVHFVIWKQQMDTLSGSSSTIMEKQSNSCDIQ
jgi:asparagine synthase (glutamine-hydrolysing)